MKPNPPPWWQLPAILVASVGALGTATVVAARYINLPKDVEAAVQKNAQQDEAINKLTAIQETWQRIYQQQQHSSDTPPRPPAWEWRQDAEGNWYCQGDQAWWWPNERNACD